NPKVERKVVLFAVIALFLIRFTNQTVRAAIGVEQPWTQAFPFHMCTVLTFVLPLSIVFDWKAIKTPVFVLSIMGGVITALLGDYFGDRFLTFFAFEGMTAHSLLIVVPIFEIAAGRYKLDLRDCWKVFAGILILMGWAMLANLVFYPSTGANYMYLMENALPFGNERNYFLFYILIFLFFFAVIYAGPILRTLPLLTNRKNQVSA
ncbi:MAG: YwaF family protein, partial [Bacillota bacterium]|nr:YwaF family protein [Bacillota bacterium]